MAILRLYSVRVLACVLAACIGPFPAAAQEADWQPQLDPPASAAGRSPQEPFVIRLSAPYDAASGRLALELDNVDVTERVQPLDDTYTSFELVPYTPLARGPHVLRMVEYRNDGNIVELGRWTFDVHVMQSAFDLKSNAGASVRVNEDPKELFAAERTQGQGSVALNAYTENDARRYAMAGDFLIDTNTTAASGHRAFDLGDFLLTRDTRHTRVALGHHVPGAAQGTAQRNLIFDGYARRGLSGTLRSGDSEVAVTGFALRTESIRGFEHGFGIGDADNRIAGAMLRFQPGSNVALGAGYVSGEGTDAGFGTGSGAAALRGEAANLALDTAWLEQRLSLRAEAAFSRVDLGETFGDATDQAWVAGFRWQPHQGLRLGEQLIPWNVDLNYARIGSRFLSIANPQQVANIEELRAGLNAWLGTVSLALTGARGEDNIDTDLYPVTRSDNLALAVNWTPAVEADFGGALFGQPTLGLNLLGDWRDTVHMPAESPALPLDFDTRGYTMFASFAHPYGTWSVTWAITNTEDHTDFSPDIRYESTGIASSFRLGERYSITPGLQLDVARDRGNGISQRAANVSVSQSWTILLDRLFWTTTVGYNRNRVSDASSRQSQVVSSTALSWQQGLFAFWLQGAWADSENEFLDFFSNVPTRFSQEQYQVFLGISMNWPGSNGTASSGGATGQGGT